MYNATFQFPFWFANLIWNDWSQFKLFSMSLKDRCKLATQTNTDVTRRRTSKVAAVFVGAFETQTISCGADGVTSIAGTGVTLDPESWPMAWWWQTTSEQYCMLRMYSYSLHCCRLKDLMTLMFLITRAGISLAAIVARSSLPFYLVGLSVGQPLWSL